MMTANINRARKSEAVATLGAIRTAERLNMSEHGAYVAFAGGNVDATTLTNYMHNTDLDGTLYHQANYSVDGVDPTHFVAHAATPAGVTGPEVTMDQDGVITGAS